MMDAVDWVEDEDLERLARIIAEQDTIISGQEAEFIAELRRRWNCEGGDCPQGK